MKSSSSKIKVLICGILPPPYFGHSVLYQMLMSSAFPHAFDVKFLNMQFWTYGTHKKVTILKLARMVKYYFQFLMILIFWRPKYILYNSSFYPMPLLKDLLFCSTGILMGGRLVIHDHGQYVAELDHSLSGFKKAALRWMLRHMTASIIMGEKVRRDYAGLTNPAKLIVVPGTVEDTKGIAVNISKSPNKINVLYFSHMSRLKGIYTAFEAVHLIFKKRRDITVTFGGPMEDHEVKRGLEELQATYPGHIRYAGYIEDVKERTKLFREADIFMFPTLRDVFGLVLLHAMAEGLPIVASREGTIPEILEDGTNAWLSPKEDAKTLAENILFLADHPQPRAKMGEANRRRFEEKYTIEKYGQAMIEAFDQMERF